MLQDGSAMIGRCFFREVLSWVRMVSARPVVTPYGTGAHVGAPLRGLSGVQTDSGRETRPLHYNKEGLD